MKRKGKGRELLGLGAAVLLLFTGCKLTTSSNNTPTPPTPKFTVTFSVEGIPANGTLKAKVDGIPETTTSPITVEKGKTVTFTAEADTDYVVKEWKVSQGSFTEGGLAGSLIAKVTVTADVTVNVIFVKPGSFEDTGDGFIKIIPPAAGITGKEPAYPLPGQDDFWRGVFRAERKVKLTPYKLGKTEITGELWLDVYNWAVGKGYMFANAGYGTHGYPIRQVSWRDCIVWCNAYTEKNKSEADCVYRKSETDNTVLKNAKDGAACDAAYADMEKKGYRLPTEAEWEYAARWQGSDSTNAQRYGDSWLTNLDSASGAKGNWKNEVETQKVACYHVASLAYCESVRSKKANALGLYDMSGNVWEWCFDSYANNPMANDSAYMSGEFVVDPQGASSTSGNIRVVRGGGYSDDALYCVVGIRSLFNSDNHFDPLGFRVACRP